MTRKELRVVDLFCGAGGLSLGFDQAGHEVVGGIDIEGGFKHTFEHNHGARFVEADLSEASGRELLDTLGLDPKHIDGVVGGPPCQGFSLAGAKTTPGDERNFLVTNFIRLVHQVEPNWFVMENVPRITSMEDGQVLNYLLTQFDKIGYETTWEVLNAAQFGVPQARERAFFVGTEQGNTFVFPEPEYRESVQQTILIGGLSPPRTVSEALSDLPALESGEQRNEYASDPVNEYQTEMRRDSLDLQNHRAPNHGERVVNRIKRAAPGEKIPYDSWSQKRRLSPDSTAPTLLAGPRPTYHFAHPEDDRGLSVRERARLQSFPDSFVFKGPVAKQRQMTGNAVPPLLSYSMGKRISQQFAD